MKRLAAILAALFALAFFPQPAASASARDLIVVVHVPLQQNDGKPIPEAALDAIRRNAAAIGPVSERAGVGSWTDPKAAPGARHVLYEPEDHIFIRTTLPKARGFLNDFLPKLQRAMAQKNTLGEMLGVAYADRDSENRTVLDVVFPLVMRGCGTQVDAVHAILNAAGGGASQYNDIDGTHVYSSVPPASVAAARTKLKQAHVTWTESVSTFVLYPKD